MTNPPTAYYNEIDPYAATWLRNLIDQGHIAPGVVDERSIEDLRPEDLDGFAQCHFFAGIGGWSLALRLAGWPDDRPVWTGSCPCQPFSAAGKGRGVADERHLWPAFHHLIRECRPGVVFGEQVAQAAGYKWWDLVAADLEGASYAAATVDIGAHSVGAPHRRQRLYWVAHDSSTRLQSQDGGVVRMADSPQFGRREERAHCGGQRAGDGAQGRPAGLEPGGDAGGMAHTNSQQRSAARGFSDAGTDWRDDARGGGQVRELGDAASVRLDRLQERQRGEAQEEGRMLQLEGASPWRDLEWLACSDGKARPTQPGLFPLAHGIPNRVGRLRAYGNAIVPQVAAAFIRSMM